MKKTLLLLLLGTILVAVLAVLLNRGSQPEVRTLPAGAPVQSAASQPSNAPPEAPIEVVVYPPPPPPLPPVVLPQRQPGRTLSPTREEVQTITARLRRGPEQEPEYSKLHAQLMALDYRDYPEEFAEMVGGPGYFSYIWTDRKRAFHANDNPEFLQAVLDYFHRELPNLRPPARYFDFIEFFSHMTNSPALVPNLVKGLDSGDYRVVSACAASLAALPTTESARALLVAAKTIKEFSADPELSMRGALAICIGQLRNPELIPLLEAELAQTKDELLAAQLKHAIMKSRL